MSDFPCNVVGVTPRDGFPGYPARTEDFYSCFRGDATTPVAHMPRQYMQTSHSGPEPLQDSSVLKPRPVSQSADIRAARGKGDRPDFWGKGAPQWSHVSVDRAPSWTATQPSIQAIPSQAHTQPSVRRTPIDSRRGPQTPPMCSGSRLRQPSSSRIPSSQQQSRKRRSQSHAPGPFSTQSAVSRPRPSLEDTEKRRFERSNPPPRHNFHSTARGRDPLGSAYRRITEQVQLGFAGMTLDPSKFSNEKVRRDAAWIVARFLKANNYPYLGHLKDLACPPASEQYQHLIDYLMSHFRGLEDPSTREEKVPKFFKELGYGSTIAKSHMKSPTAPMTWPQHLASLAWLVATIGFEESMSIFLDPDARREFSQPSMPIRTPRVLGSRGWLGEGSDSVFSQPLTAGKLEALGVRPPKEDWMQASLRCIWDAYTFHLQSQAEAAEQGRPELVDTTGMRKIIEKSLVEARARTETHCEEVQRLYKEVADDMQMASEKLRANEELKKRHETLLSEEKRLESQTLKMETARSQHERKLRAVECDDSLLEQKCFELEIQLKEVQQKIEAQGMTKDDVARIRQMTDTQRSNLEQLKKERVETEEVMFNLNEKASEVERNVDRLFNSSKQLLSGIDSVVGRPGTPQSARNSNSSLPPPLLCDVTCISDKVCQEILAERFKSQGDAEKEAVIRGLRNAMGGIDFDLWKSRTDAFVEDKEKKLEKLSNEKITMKNRMSQLTTGIKQKTEVNRTIGDSLGRLKADVRRAAEKKKDLQRRLTTEKQEIDMADRAALEEAKQCQTNLIQLNKEAREILESTNAELDREKKKLAQELDEVCEVLTAGTEPLVSCFENVLQKVEAENCWLKNVAGSSSERRGDPDSSLLAEDVTAIQVVGKTPKLTPEFKGEYLAECVDVVTEGKSR